jgi:hypothetical protein
VSAHGSIARYRIVHDPIVRKILPAIDLCAQRHLLPAAVPIDTLEFVGGNQLFPDAGIDGLDVDQGPDALQAIEARPHIALLIVHGVTGYSGDLLGKIADDAFVLLR